MPFKKIKNLFVKNFFILALLIFSFSAYSFLDSQIFAKKQLKEQQYQVDVLSSGTADLNFNLQSEDNNYLDFYPKEVRQPTSGTSAVGTAHSVSKNHKYTTLDVQKLDEIDNLLKVCLYKVNGNFRFSNFDNLTGFLIQKQLKTNC